MQTKTKKEKLVSLGREKLGKKTNESATSTSQLINTANQADANRVEEELQKVAECSRM